VGDRAGAGKQVKKAIKYNKHLPAFLSGKRRLPRRLPEAFRPGHPQKTAGARSLAPAAFYGLGWPEGSQGSSGTFLAATSVCGCRSTSGTVLPGGKTARGTSKTVVKPVKRGTVLYSSFTRGSRGSTPGSLTRLTRQLPESPVLGWGGRRFRRTKATPSTAYRALRSPGAMMNSSAVRFRRVRHRSIRHIVDQ